MGRRRTAAMIGALSGAFALALTGCTAPEPSAAPMTPSPAASSAVPTTPAATEDAEPVLRPELPAAENLAYFDSVNRAVIAAEPEAGGRAFIDALVAAGFDRAAMEVTADTTTIGDPADSIQFAVLVGADCLIGQYGPKSDGYHSAVRPALATGGCLVGDTRPIDW